jgi:hypothetical protein
LPPRHPMPTYCACPSRRWPEVRRTCPPAPVVRARAKPEPAPQPHTSAPTHLPR